MADAAEGARPMTTRGAPHRAAPSPNQAASRRVPTRSAAAAEASTAPAPRAALSTPTPGSPRPTSSTATTTVNTVMAPRMKVWAPIRPMSRRRSVLACTARTPPRVWARAPSGSPARSSGVGSGCTRAISAPAHAEATAATTSTCAGPAVASRTALTAGPASVAAESRAPRTTLAPASSGGVSHSDGSSAECTGRKSTAAADDRVTRA